MHPANRLLSIFGLRIARDRPAAVPVEFRQRYDEGYQRIQGNRRGFEVFRHFIYEAGEHPSSHVDFQCAFAAEAIASRSPTSILDVGSYRHFILGLLGRRGVTTLDVRSREPATTNETVLTSDAKSIKAAAGQFDLVVSLCALEHFGLGRYGDEFDPDGDTKALAEMTRVLRPGGALVFSTTITRARPSIGFNAHRIYDYAMISEMRGNLRLEREAFFSHNRGRATRLEDVTTEAGAWDVYCGCWAKESDDISPAG
jgi:SAM-dependent methyltransferase